MCVWQAMSVERYDSRNAVGISEAVKWQHVLPFLPALTSFFVGCERAVTDGEAGTLPVALFVS